MLFVVGKEDVIGFSWLLCWYLPHIMDIVAESFRCCPILCLWIDFFYRRTVVVRLVNGRRNHFCVPNGRCCWTYSDPEVITGELCSLVVIQVQVQVALSL